MRRRRATTPDEDGRDIISSIRRVLLLIALALPAAAAFAPAGSAALTPVTRDSSGSAAPPTFRVVIVPSLNRSDLRLLVKRGAVGLLVPGVGSLIDRRAALMSLASGANVNSHLRQAAAGRAVISVTESTRLPLAANTIIVSLPQNTTPQSNDRRFPMALIGGGCRGLLVSATTRIAGLVAMTDIAPTALGRLRGSLKCRPAAHPLLSIEKLDIQIHANNRLKMPTLIIVSCLVLLLAAIRPRMTLPAILAALLASLVAGALHIGSETALVALMVVGTLAGGAVIERLTRDDRALLVVTLFVLGLHVALLVLRPDWVAITPLGPTQNSRFWGIGNQLETLLLAPVVAGAAVAARRYGLVGFGLFAALSLALITDNRLGSDGGGAIVFGIALAYIGCRVWGAGITGFITLLALTVLTATAIIVYDLRMPGPDHLRSAFSHGLPGLWRVAENRVPLAYVPALQQWMLVVPISIVFASAFAIALRFSDRRARDLLFGAGLGLIASLVVNDSAAYELAGGIAVVAALASFSGPPVAAAQAQQE